MAVPSSSPLRTKSSASEAEAAVATVDGEQVTKNEEVVKDGEVAIGDGEVQRKRTKDPGVRVIGGRIYCSLNGKTCHQCRQKTLDFSAECKNMKGLKQCTIKFCQKCLKNRFQIRYGEKASEVAKFDNWHCPKCRGICNCSFCMKKRGHQPTGILVHTAKKTGFSSVSEMLNLGSPSNVVKDSDQSPNKPSVSNKLVVVSPSKLGKENSFDKDIDFTSPSVKFPEKSSKKRKSEGLKEISNGRKADDASLKDKHLESDQLEDKRLRKKVKGKEKAEPGHKATTKRKRKKHVLEGDSTKEEEPTAVRDDGDSNETGSSEAIEVRADKNITAAPVEVPLPKGTLLIAVAGVDLPAEAVGDVLQFLEFCAAFGKVLDLRKGQAEALLRELVSTRRRRTGPASLIVRFHLQLLSFLQEDIEEELSSSSPTNEQSSWLKALGEFATESQSVLRGFPLNCFEGGAEGYDNLDISKKLRLLNFLCDEVLNTEPFRTWIEEQNTKFIEDGKEAKEKLLAAKTKEKALKQKLQNELAEAIIAKNGVPLSISEHEAIVSQVKDEIAQARADVLHGKTSNKRQRSDAVRTEPLFLDSNGHAFWKLKTSDGDSDILLQELGNGDSVGSDEKWFIYEPEKKDAVDAYIYSVIMAKRHRVRANQPSASDSMQQVKIMA
ncbi:uncharacterized protein LOC116209177 isoform X2 [Punica granatum]|uniref:Uncharacterized protein LOC116209177 isoform X2 n=1 Tax=Punica granatum TaxID=22663 RepID=A0A6P8DRK8_PUNGR|nr:uncharacterized protein LOC116209177 isoform X2 [Punica granatum]